MWVHFYFPETHWFKPGGRISHPLVTSPCHRVWPPAQLLPPVPEALGGALTATFLILMTTREGEGIVGPGGMKGFPEPNFKANWENGWGCRLFCNLSLFQPNGLKLAKHEKKLSADGGEHLKRLSAFSFFRIIWLTVSNWRWLGRMPIYRHGSSL